MNTELIMWRPAQGAIAVYTAQNSLRTPKHFALRKYDTYIEVYGNYSGKTFLRKGSSPNPFPKTFDPNFSHIERIYIQKGFA